MTAMLARRLTRAAEEAHKHTCGGGPTVRVLVVSGGIEIWAVENGRTVARVLNFEAIEQAAHNVALEEVNLAVALVRRAQVPPVTA
jgi:hypothetical protein